MLDLAPKCQTLFCRPWRVNRKSGKEKWEKSSFKLYEIQDPAEAEAVVSLGADHVGSVLVSESDWKSEKVKDTVRAVRENGAFSTIIPLYNDLDNILKTLDYYRPDIVHFCESLVEKKRPGRLCPRSRRDRPARRAPGGDKGEVSGNKNHAVGAHRAGRRCGHGGIPSFWLSPSNRSAIFF